MTGHSTPMQEPRTADMDLTLAFAKQWAVTVDLETPGDFMAQRFARALLAVVEKEREPAVCRSAGANGEGKCRRWCGLNYCEGSAFAQSAERRRDQIEVEEVLGAAFADALQEDFEGIRELVRAVKITFQDGSPVVTIQALRDAYGVLAKSKGIARRCVKCGGCETQNVPASCDCPSPQFAPSATASSARRIDPSGGPHIYPCDHCANPKECGEQKVCAYAECSECRRFGRRLAKIDRALDEMGAPKTEQVEGLTMELSHVGRIKRLAQSATLPSKWAECDEEARDVEVLLNFVQAVGDTLDVASQPREGYTERVLTSVHMLAAARDEMVKALNSAKSERGNRPLQAQALDAATVLIRECVEGTVDDCTKWNRRARAFLATYATTDSLTKEKP